TPWASFRWSAEIRPYETTGTSELDGDMATSDYFLPEVKFYNLVYREEEREMIPFCRDQCVGVVPWSPLARGLLAGTWERGGERRTVRSAGDTYGEELYDEDDFAVVDAVRAVAKELGVPPARVALAWLLGRPGVTAPACGATRTRHLDDALAAVDLVLGAAETERLEAPYRPHPVRGHT
ncbi:aldo/keto reductase, partial [Actinomadura sp. DC4]|uniref:aldo/keto reductase n=1 Tax=Actinomadura sp. DC4 TaxID=3055069 RepID=UPI0025AFAC6B